jgi:hypothetical protein
MVLMPPGSAKSTYASVLFPAWWFTRHPRTAILATSHSYNLAEYFSRRTRSLIEDNGAYLGYGIAPSQRTAGAWNTTSGGEYVAIGLRGATAGRRADLVIIDDPVKSQADAESPRQRAHLWDWYRSDITTRLKPDGKVVVIMTRWHPEDLGGQLLAQAPSEWRVLRLPALAEAGDPIGRLPGEALWPAWEDLDALQRKRSMVGERVWSALYQQSPMPSAGRLFMVERIPVVTELPVTAECAMVRAWDLAATGQSGRNDPDWTVGVKMLVDRSGRYCVLDIVRLRASPHEVEHAMLQTALGDGREVVISIPEDPGQAGKSQITYLTRRLAGYHVKSTRESGSKAVRAMPVASQVEAGNVSIVKSDWNRLFIDELRDFPWGRKDDQVDAFVRAFTYFTDRAPRRAALAMSVFDR